MKSCRRQSLAERIECAADGVCRCHMSRVGIRIAKEVCQRDGVEAVVVGEVGAVEFHHVGSIRRPSPMSGVSGHLAVVVSDDVGCVVMMFLLSGDPSVLSPRFC